MTRETSGTSWGEGDTGTTGTGTRGGVRLWWRLLDPRHCQFRRMARRLVFDAHLDESRRSDDGDLRLPLTSDGNR